MYRFLYQILRSSRGAERTKPLGSIRKPCTGAVVSHYKLDVIVRVCSVSIRRPKSRSCLRFVSTRNHYASMLLCYVVGSTLEHVPFSYEGTLDHDCFSSIISFEIALLRSMPCFAPYFVRLHRHQNVPYANLVSHIIIYVATRM